MIELTHNEIEQVHGGFKFHFNIIGTVCAIAAGVALGNPLAVVGAVGAAIMTQGAGNLKDMFDAHGYQYHLHGSNEPFSYLAYQW